MEPRPETPVVAGAPAERPAVAVTALLCLVAAAAGVIVSAGCTSLPSRSDGALAATGTPAAARVVPFASASAPAALRTTFKSGFYRYSITLPPGWTARP